MKEKKTDIIIQKEDKVLRQKAKEIDPKDIKSHKIQNIIKKMREALEGEEDGIAIAAPQIGESLQMFIISEKIFDLMEEEKYGAKKEEQEENKKEMIGLKKIKDLVFINPQIIKTSKKKLPMEEGCLSVRWLYGKVLRSEKTLLKAYDRDGKIFTFGASGLLSQIFQHETDHLKGVLFIDKAKELKNIPPDNSE